MPAERLSMRKIRDVLRLRFGSRLSEREIGRSLLLSNAGSFGGPGLALAGRLGRRDVGVLAVLR